MYLQRVDTIQVGPGLQAHQVHVTFAQAGCSCSYLGRLARKEMAASGGRERENVCFGRLESWKERPPDFRDDFTQYSAQSRKAVNFHREPSLHCTSASC
jgi:hypothetical protein